MTPRAAAVRRLRASRLCAILDVTRPAAPVVFTAGRLRAGGVRVFQLRAKGLSDRAVLALLAGLRRVLRGCSLFVNDRADLAVAGGADGVHLGADDLPLRAARRLTAGRLALGASAGSPGELVRALEGALRRFCGDVDTEVPDYVRAALAGGGGA
ncbi:MAG: thiamine phosphate synthase [bacterium]